MPRTNFALCDLVSKNSNDIKAHVNAWRDGEELEHVLLYNINKAIGKGKSNIGATISVDCKLMETISMEALKPFQEALSVPL